MFTVLFVGCVTTDPINYKNGYYIVNFDYDFDQVYKASSEVIKDGETLDTDGEAYILTYNKSAKKRDLDRAVLKGNNDSNAKDTILVIVSEISENITKVSIKYGEYGNSIRASTFVENLKKKLSSNS